MTTDLVTTGEAARLLGVARITIHYYLKAGHLTATKYGRDFLIPRAQVVALATSPIRRKKKEQH